MADKILKSGNNALMVNGNPIKVDMGANILTGSFYNYNRTMNISINTGLTKMPSKIFIYQKSDISNRYLNILGWCGKMSGNNYYYSVNGGLTTSYTLQDNMFTMTQTGTTTNIKLTTTATEYGLKASIYFYYTFIYE